MSVRIFIQQHLRNINIFKSTAFCPIIIIPWMMTYFWYVQLIFVNHWNCLVSSFLALVHIFIMYSYYPLKLSRNHITSIGTYFLQCLHMSSVDTIWCCLLITFPAWELIVTAQPQPQHNSTSIQVGVDKVNSFFMIWYFYFPRII